MSTTVINIAFTPDELEGILEDLDAFHGEDDFEPECPVCAAVRKFRAALAALPLPEQGGPQERRE